MTAPAGRVPAEGPVASGAAALRLVRDGRVATLTIAREQVGNAIDRETGAALDALLADLERDDDLACLVLTGEGDRFFCTGGDLRDYAALDSAESARGTSLRMQRTLARLEAMPALSVAAVGGLALGGGLELALACDVRVADERARLALPQARLGVITAWGGLHRLARAVGRSQALALFASAGVLDASEALRVGLVDAVSGPGAALADAHALAHSVASSSLAAVHAMKPALALEEDADALADLFGRLWDAPDHRAAERAAWADRAWDQRQG